MGENLSQNKVRVSNDFKQLIILIWRILISNLIRKISFYVSLIMSVAIITVCLFWPTTAYEVIMGEDIKITNQMKLTESKLTNYILYTGYIPQNPPSTSAKESAVKLAASNHFTSIFCGTQKDCEHEIFQRSKPEMNDDIYLSKSSTFYATYEQRTKDNEINLLLRIPFHHTFNLRNLFYHLIPFKIYLDNYVIEALNSEKLKKHKIEYGVNIATHLPHKAHVEEMNPLTQFSAGVMGAHVYLGMTVMVIHMSSSIVFDKEMELRSLMSIMGMQRLPYILSYVLLYGVVLIILALYADIIIILQPKLVTVSVRTIKTYSMIFINYLVTGLLIMTQGLLLSTFTRSVRIITFIVLLVECLQMIVGMTVLKFHLEQSDKKSDSNISFMNYIFPVISFFNAQIELSSNLPVTGREKSSGTKIIFLSAMTVITFLIAIYLDFVIDTGTGHSFPWYFPISSITRRFKKKDVQAAYSPITEGNTCLDTYFTEKVNNSLVKVRLIDVEKRFVKTLCCRVTEVRAVQNLSIDLQEGMITAILGHNGAGKTTTFSMLVGILHATNGKIRIYGLNPDDPWDKGVLNKMTSICMQKDILIGEMTCLEHMRFFGVIKGLSNIEIISETNNLFQVLELLKEKNKRTNILSGGQLRKLCVAIALLGDPKVVILDEPTSGVDPISRRSIWNALKTYKQNRILILSTHYMDEADILADWKAIMVKGQIVCYGTSMFLKKKFNLGYILNCSLKSDQNDVSDLLAMIKSSAPSSEFQKRYGMEVTFKVHDEEIVSLCQYMSSAEGTQKLKVLGVMDYGISVTKLEEIFLKLGEIEVDEPDRDADDIEQILDDNLVQMIKLSSKVSHNDELNLNKISVANVNTDQSSFMSGFFQFWTFIRLNILLTMRSPAFAILRTVGPVSAVALAAILFVFETRKAENFEATGKNLSMITEPWPPYIIYTFERDKYQEASSKEFMEDLFCIRRMYGERFLFTNESDIVRSIKGSTHILITHWNVKSGYKLAFQHHLSFKDGLYNIFQFQMLLQNCFMNRLMGVDISKTIKYYIIADSWNINWVASKHPSFRIVSAFVYLISLSAAFNLMNPVICGDVVRDRILGNLDQMTLYGLKYMSYWASHFVIHVLHHAIIMCIIIIFMSLVDNYLFSNPAYAFVFALLYFVSSIDTILSIYCISLVFNDIVAAEISLSFSILIPMFVMSVVVFCPLKIMNALHITFVTFFPFLNPWVTVMMIDFKTRQQRHYLYDNFDNEYVIPFRKLMDYKPVRNSFIIHIIHIILFGAFFCGYNWYIFVYKRHIEATPLMKLMRKLRSGESHSRSVSVTMEGFAVGANEDLEKNKGLVEEIIASDNSSQNISAAVGDLTKVYHSLKNIFTREIETTIALSNINLIVNKGEVFGLLGPSGAGKTTAMNCISQLMKPSSGKVIIFDRSTKSFIHGSEALSKNLIGLCPQNNPIWPNLTVREHLLVYTALRNIPRRMRNLHCLNLIKLVHLKKYTNSLADSLSGGCKRRLSMAISFTGQPDLILLDEPSCGVDPKSRRNLWDTISSAIHNTDKGAVITSQFMEECEALCNRLGIIVNGRIMCIGSPQELKSKFGRGISVDIKIIPGADANATFKIKSTLTQYLLDLYPRLLTIENFGERLTYRIPKSPEITFGSVFKSIHEAKSKFEIEDYAVSQPTLEQVYFDFAKYQTKEDLRYDVQVNWK